ncbi:MAG TPA: PorT family protein, partial [Flavobacterium sp.]
KDIVDISMFNFYPVAGITFGVKHVRLNVSYQYGVMNMLNNLNDKDLGVNFKGNPGIANANLIFYL